VLRAIGVSSSREGRAVLDDLSLYAPAGEMVVVEGGRGAGKSTLLEISAGLRRPDAGEVWIAGRDVTGLQRASLPYVRRNVGYAGVAAAFIPDVTVRENLALALAARGYAPPAAYALVSRVLGGLGLEGLGARRAAGLSAAEHRLVALARALAGAPPLLVVDDPSALLAPSDVEMVLSVLFAASAAGAAVLCASADGAFIGAAARGGARRMRLADGCVLSAAGPRGVAASPRPAPLGGPIRGEARP
jgi:ABC-type ATPase involved in cell division